MNFIRFLYWHPHGYQGLPGDSVVKNTPASAGDLGDAVSVPGSEKSLGVEMASHSSILAWKTPWARGACWATVHGVTKSQT